MGSLKDQIEKAVKDQLQELYTAVNHIIYPLFTNNSTTYMHTITTPNEVFAWAERNKCPVCKSPLSQKYDTITTIDWDDHYTSEFSCIDPKDEYHYSVILEFEDPKDICLSEETIMDFYDDDYNKEYHLEIKYSTPLYRPSKPIEIKLIWWEEYGDNKESEFFEMVDYKLFDPKNYNKEEWKQLVNTIILYR